MAARELIEKTKTRDAMFMDAGIIFQPITEQTKTNQESSPTDKEESTKAKQEGVPRRFSTITFISSSMCPYINHGIQSFMCLCAGRAISLYLSVVLSY